MKLHIKIKNGPKKAEKRSESRLITEVEAGGATKEKIKEIETLKDFSIQERVLAYAMLHDQEDAVVDYFINKSGKRVPKNYIKTEDEINNLYEKFKKEPKQCKAIARINLMKIADDEKLSQSEKESRLERYLDAYINLVIKIDHANYPPSDKVYGPYVPEYIPDGLSDMGSDPEIDEEKRSREKIRVDKKAIHEQCKDFLLYILGRKLPKEEIVQQVANYMHRRMEYDYKGEALPERGKSVPLKGFMEKELGQCRHHALYTQVLLQELGLTSRLLKCDVAFGDRYAGPHGSNLVMINNKWYLLDVTNPTEGETPGGIVFLEPIPEKDIDLNKETYTWELSERPGGRSRKHKSRNNMYYRIRKN